MDKVVLCLKIILRNMYYFYDGDLYIHDYVL